jgi:methylphosphotriester-DNA--protein-cysteine methyltransferase
MEYLEHRIARPEIAEGVEVIFDLREYCPEHARERLVPDGRMHLVMELDGRPRHIYDNATGESRQVCKAAWFSGVHSNHFIIGDTDQGSSLMAIQFSPGGAVAFTQRASSDFCDAVVPAEDVFGVGVLELRETLLRTTSAEARLTLMEAWLAKRFDSTWTVPDPVSKAVDALQQSPANVRWTEWVAENTTVSYKHFVHLFRRHVGPTPKVMQRVLRFASVFQRLQAGEAPDLAELSLELGFSDQAHFSREFRVFSGYRPSDFLREGHDRINFFPEEDAGGNT